MLANGLQKVYEYKQTTLLENSNSTHTWQNYKKSSIFSSTSKYLIFLYKNRNNECNESNTIVLNILIIESWGKYSKI